MTDPRNKLSPAEQRQKAESLRNVAPTLWVRLNGSSRILFTINVTVPILLPVVIGGGLWFLLMIGSYFLKMPMPEAMWTNLVLAMFVAGRLAWQNIKMHDAVEDLVEENKKANKG